MGGRKRTKDVPLSDRYSEILANINKAIKVKGYRHHLGLFDNIEDARSAYEQARLDFRTDEMSAT